MIFIRHNHEQTENVTIIKLSKLDEISHQSVYCRELSKYALNKSDHEQVKASIGNLQAILKVLDRAKVVSEKYYNFLIEEDIVKILNDD